MFKDVPLLAETVHCHFFTFGKWTSNVFDCAMSECFVATKTIALTERSWGETTVAGIDMATGASSLVGQVTS